MELASYLVEGYEPGLTATTLAEVAERLRTLADELSRTGECRVVHRFALYAPEDEVCLHVFEACGPECVALVAERAGLSVDRIVVAITADGTTRGPHSATSTLQQGA